MGWAGAGAALPFPNFSVLNFTNIHGASAGGGYKALGEFRRLRRAHHCLQLPGEGSSGCCSAGAGAGLELGQGGFW